MVCKSDCDHRWRGRGLREQIVVLQALEKEVTIFRRDGHSTGFIHLGIAIGAH